MNEQFRKFINLNIIIFFIFIVMFILIRFLFTEVQRGNQLSWLDSSLPYFFVFCFIFIFLVLGIMPFRHSMIISKNTTTLARLLNTEVKRPFFGLWFYKVIKGHIRGREIICKIQLITNESNMLEIYIKPNTSSERHKSGFLSKKITDKTRFYKDRILYSPKILDSDGWGKLSLIHKVHTEKDFIDIFEELIKAAEIVETGQEL